jgi:hypothetical protein
VTQKTEQLTSQRVGRLKPLSTSTGYESGIATSSYLDESAPGAGIVYEVTLDGTELEQFAVRRYSATSPRLTRRLVRDAPVDAIAVLARHALAEAVGVSQYMLDHLEGVQLTRQDGSTAPLEMPGLHKFVAVEWGDFKRPGRAGRSDLEYASLAREYADEVRLAGGRGAAKRVAERHYLSVSQVRNLLYEAKRRKLKTGAAPGVAGGKLTEKALALLDGKMGDSH